MGNELEVFEEGKIKLGDMDKAVIYEMLEKNPKLKKQLLDSKTQRVLGRKDIVSNKDKNAFLLEVKNRVLEHKRKLLQPEKDRLKIETQDLENKSIEFENETEDLQNVSNKIETELNTYSNAMKSLESTINMIDEVYLPEITKEMKELEKSAKTKPEDR